jgi:hypothetical protein
MTAVSSLVPAVPTAVDINSALLEAERHARQVVAMAIRAGTMLVEAKGRVGHGNWEAWLSDNITAVKPRTAQAYMRLATKFRQLPDPEAQRVADLPLRDAIKAIATPAVTPPRASRDLPGRPRADVDGDAAALDACRAALNVATRGISGSPVKREDVQRARDQLGVAIEVLDKLLLTVADAA